MHVRPALALALTALGCLLLPAPAPGWEVRLSSLSSHGEAYLAGDLDGDGNEEIVDLRVIPQVASVVVLRLQEDGQHLTPHVFDGMDRMRPIRGAVGDVDGDGFDDFLVVQRPTGLHDELNLFRGAAAPAPPTRLALGDVTQSRRITAIEGLGDLDGDGRGELIVVCEGGAPAYLFTGHPTTGLELLHELSSPTGRPVAFARSATAAGDFDGDGHPDFAVTEAADANGEAVVHLYAGGPGYDTTPDRQLVAGNGFGPLPALSQGVFDIGDIDGDGRSDLLAGGGGDFLLFLGSPSSSVVEPAARLGSARGWPLPTQPGAGPVGPDPADGQHLFVLAGDRSGPMHDLFVYAWESGATGGTLAPRFATVGANRPSGVDGNLDRLLGTADYDGDGRAEPVTGADLVRHIELFHDCDQNGQDDAAQVAAGELGDCDANGLADICEVATGEHEDCNGDGIPGDCQFGAPTDCNANGVLDACDIANGLEEDCNGDGVPDACQVDVWNDCNGNGVLDTCDIASGLEEDCNGNGVPDSCELSNGYYDCDGNGQLDACEIARGEGDCDGNGQLDVCENKYTGDCNDNGRADFCDIASGDSEDCDGNAVPDECTAAPHQDCNGNGVPDTCESLPTEDCNGNGVPDLCDYRPERDCDGNGRLDSCDLAANPRLDCDDDGTIDSCEEPGDVEAGVEDNCPARAFQGLYLDAALTLRAVEGVSGGSTLQLWLGVENQAANADTLQLWRVQGELVGLEGFLPLAAPLLHPGSDLQSGVARFAIEFDPPVRIAPGERTGLVRFDLYATSSLPAGAIEVAMIGLEQGGFVDDADPVWFGAAGLFAHYLESLPAIVNGSPPATGTGDTPLRPALGLEAHPNPFNPRTTVRVFLPAASVVRLVLVDGRGRLVRRVHEGPLPAGQHDLRLDGRGLASGSYRLLLESGSGSATAPVVLLR